MALEPGELGSPHSWERWHILGWGASLSCSSCAQFHAEEDTGAVRGMVEDSQVSSAVFIELLAVLSTIQIQAVWRLQLQGQHFS